MFVEAVLLCPDAFNNIVYVSISTDRFVIDYVNKARQPSCIHTETDLSRRCLLTIRNEAGFDIVQIASE